MKSIFTLLFLSAQFFLFAQNDAVKTYYTAHNKILEQFARTKDTAKYLDNMYYFIHENGKKYMQLTHHNNLFELSVAQKNWKLAELIFEWGYKYNIATHYYGLDSSYINSLKYREFFGRENIKEIHNRSSEYYQELIKNIHLLKSIQLNTLTEIDQFSRYMLDVPDLDTSYKVVSAVLTYTDSTNLVKFYNYLEEYGFPDADEVGFFADALIMMHTFMRPCDNSYTLPNGQSSYDYFDSVYLDAVQNGQYGNVYYAYMKDRSYTDPSALNQVDCEWKGQKYVTWFHGGKLSGDLYDAKNIDKHRAEIYLPPYWVDAVLNGWEIPADYPVPDNVKLKY